VRVPYFRPSIGDAEIDEVVATLRSGWLTTGPRCREFEERFAAAVGAGHAVALGSCTAALHLALDALSVGPGDLVLVPALAFAATAEVVHHVGAVPVFVDVDPATLCMDAAAAARTLAALREGRSVAGLSPPYGRARAVIPIHYAGVVADVVALRRVTADHGLSMVEDCAHAFPGRWREAGGPWRHAGDGADVACFSFYANKTLCTGEGGMATTARSDLAERIRTMSLHGMSRDAWRRFERGGSWDYEIVAAGHKYNLADVAAALGLVQLRRAADLWERRRVLAARYAMALADLEGLLVPAEPPDRQSSWHLYVARVRARRDEIVARLAERGVGTSVHWRPLPMQPYYRDRFRFRPEDFPVAAREFRRLISLPLFPDMTEAEQDYVIRELRSALAWAANPSGS
jgi:dTDP-4-amino-4,6-dideoxygalactose transaminase